MTVDAALIEMMDRVLATHGPTARPCADPDIWQALDELGLVRLTGSPEHGGSGAGWAEAAELISAAVRHAVRVPLAEHDLLACWLLEAAGLPADSNRRTVCVLDDSGTATSVPWASTARRIVVVWADTHGHHLVDADAAAMRITPGTNMVDEPRDTVTADLTDLAPYAITVPEELVEQLRLKSALVRSLQVCAALDTIVDLVIEHTSTRVQFGRPLSKFQAIQHLVADLAAEAALARAATEAAMSTAIATDWSGASLAFRVATARSCTGHAASVVVRNAHQAFGAIGTTVEHTLHRYTRAALAWRSEYGSVQHWDEQLTRGAVAAGAAGLWPLIAG
ncbi:acyl-CoA dehydrogenase [Mycolicibacterium duvalii]|uniref:Acyl-CoA dehydrogenase n=1 Tax=Mycolicibacterium duvalii TaxID=39688 RepID=A0A7I7K0Y4_9MYCO|nr:acyl-CoA dehydrogenase family protein [Mycolicibacterium duvalii]MCV7366570.1 acyl-CoA/acyl-ACP dehydrogenase [Mycolicibacterium duvalii]PEG41637.1 acyl-CoA dehydrogenase [Mycolicibacterium duvalii]BBX17820.1 acyl-CoA dehydrogenase [Mycolicibacterium duvalii]